MNKIKKLRKQLKEMGINKAQGESMTTEGYPAIMVRWNGDEEIFTGIDPLGDPGLNEYTEQRLERFKDENLS